MNSLNSDKTQVIIAVTLLCIIAMISMGPAGAKELVGNTIAGLFGIAVGMSTKAEV